MNAPVPLELCLCPLGCTTSDTTLFVARDLIQHLPGEFPLVRCDRCGLMRTNPRPTAESMHFYYPENYGPYLGTRVTGPGERGNQPSALGVARLAIKGWLTRHVDFRTQSIPDMPPGRMLEVGCASGAYLHKMAARGWIVEGIEFAASAADRASRLGFKVHSGSIESAPDPLHEYDLVVAWMVLEHLHDPLGSLTKLARWAKPEAALAVSLPDAGCMGFRLFGARWHALHIPNHLFHFTVRTASLMLETAGWRVVAISHHRTLANYFCSLSHVLQDYGFHRLAGLLSAYSAYKSGILEYVFFPLAWVLAVLGQSGQMTIWARKA